MKHIKFVFIGITILFLMAMPSMVLGQYYQDIDIGVHGADFDRVAQTGWQFLKLPTNAQQAGMGGIFTSISHGDASSALTNPAFVVDVEKIDVSFSRMNWIADIGYQSGAIVKNFGKWGAFGLHFISVGYGDMFRTEYVQGAGGNVEAVLDLGTFTASDLAVGLTYARRITNLLQVGGNVRFIQEKIDDATTSNYAVDIGTICYTGLKTLRLAMVGRNFGPDAQFTTWDERIQVPPSNVRMPMIFALGAAVDILEGKGDNPHLMTVAAEFTHPNDGPEKVNVGVEYTYLKLLSLRGGYRFNYDEEGFTFGGGINVRTSSLAVNFNYSYWAFGILGSVNMFSIGLGL